MSKKTDIAEKPGKSELLTKVWAGEAYGARLEETPHAALAEIGVQVSGDLQIKVVMDSERLRYFRIPTPPQQGEISDGDLLDAQGGTTPICAASVTIVATHIAISVTVHA
ncbi:MAG: hypothetical protein AB3N15_07735 [Paracoccaceae bacterium]